MVTDRVKLPELVFSENFNSDQKIISSSLIYESKK